MFLQETKQAISELSATQIENIIVLGRFLFSSSCVVNMLNLGMEETPEDCLSFMSMMITDDGTMYKMPGETLDPHTDVAVMPYSSGTTGPAKGVCLTHYNLVANCCQVSSPEVSDVR